MADQNPPVEGNGVGGPDGAAAEQAGQQTFDRSSTEPGSQRYEDVQAAYTRSQQELIETQRAHAALVEQQQWYELLTTAEDPDIRRQAAEALGYEVPEEEQSSDEDRDPFEQYDTRIQTLEERDAQREAQQQELENVRAVREVLDAQLEELVPGAQHPDPDVAKGVKFDQDQVLAYAINALPVGEDGLPQVELAHQLWSQRNDARQQDWARSKRAPMFSPGGQTATEVPNLDNDQERQDYMTRRLLANQEP